MKKILALTTALVAVSSMPALAADPIKLQLGGFVNWYVGYAQQDEDFERATGTNWTRFDVQGDNEIFFNGSTKLDNGLKVGITVELEAGGNQDGGDYIDESFAYVEGAFGKVILGTEDNAGALMHVSAPDVGIALQDGDYPQWIVSPGNIAGQSFLDATSTYASRDDNNEKIIYISPTFAGFSAGVSFTPTVGVEDRRSVNNLNTAAGGEGVSASLGYNNTFGGLTVAASAGYYTQEDTRSDDVNEWHAGLRLGFAGFTLGGSFRSMNEDLTTAAVLAGAGALDGTAFDVGISYATGPFAVSLGYYESSVEATAAAGDDVVHLIQLSGSYEMGPGVSLIGSVLNVDYDSEIAGPTMDNSGWAVVSGLRLAF